MMAFRPAVGQPALLPPPARSSVVVRSTGWADSKATNAEKAMFGEVGRPEGPACFLMLVQRRSFNFNCSFLQDI